MSIALAHYYCEFAAQKFDLGELSLAKELLNQAVSYDRNCVRAAIQLGETELRSGRPEEAIKSLKQVKQYGPEFVSETISLLRDAFAQIGKAANITEYLKECYKAHPDPAIALAITEDLFRREGFEAARTFLSQELAVQPSLHGLSRLIRLQQADFSGRIRENIDQLLHLIDLLIKERMTYKCDHCGFAGQQLHWYCPGCKYWGTVRPLNLENLE